MSYEPTVAEVTMWAAVPEDVPFATKPQFAQAMLERLFAANVAPAWVTGDEMYGGDRSLLLWLEEHPFVLAVKSSEYVFFADGARRDGAPGPYAARQRHAKDVAATLTEGAWQRLSAGDGAKGPRLDDWAELPLARWPDPRWDHRLLVRRSLTDPTDLAYYVVFAPAGTPLTTLVRVAGTRWMVEECFAAAKGEVELDHDAVRRYPGWYRHIILSLLAFAVLVAVRAQT